MSDILASMSESDKKRFWAMVNVGDPDACWEWNGFRSAWGNGQFGIGGRLKQRKLLAHRVAFTLSTGVEIAAGLSVLHECDNPACCNPAHLHTGTHQDNMNEMKSRGRAPISFGAAKLNWKSVDEIRLSDMTPKDLSRKYGVSKVTISDILNKKTWREEKRHVSTGLS